ncbi:MAG: transcriptional regulator, GntR family [Actinomycetia bacterium]|nr:transcriptional regulator, GntR family [Actinomycetes bacterium]
MYDFLTEDRVRDTTVEHLEIVDLTLAGKLPDALMALRRHVGESSEVVEQRAVRAYTQMTLHRALRLPKTHPCRSGGMLV